MPSMRTNLPPTEAAPSPRDSLRRALLLSLLLVMVWTAIAFLPDPELPAEPVSGTEQVEHPSSTDAELAAGSTEVSAVTTVPASPATKLGEDTGLISPEARSLFGPGYLLVLILLGLAGTWALWLKGRSSGVTATSGLSEIGRFRLGPQQQIQLVKCADEVLLLGVSSGSINLLKAYPAATFPAQKVGMTQTADTPTVASALKNMVQSFKAASKPKPADSPPDPDFLVNGDPLPPDAELPEWTIATASAISDGPDFMHVLRRYAGKKTYKANTLYPPTGATN